MTPFKLFYTDYYQISMSLAYMLDGKANEQAGFEAFVRRIKVETNPNQSEYVFSGEREVHELMSDIRDELKNPELLDTFLALALKDIDGDRYDDYDFQVRHLWDTLQKDFEYSVYPEGASVQPYVPVFQYWGPRWIGQLIETQLCNVINGRTGYQTYRKYGSDTKLADKVGQMVLEQPMGCIDEGHWFAEYESLLSNRAREFRDSLPKDKILLEAGMRRAPSIHCAKAAASHARRWHWSGSSNVHTLFNNTPLDFVGGTMAHSFVMSYENELDAYKAWDRIFPNSTILIDTYDTINAAKLLIEHDIKPADVRIDCEPLGDLARQVRKIFDENDWEDVGIFISGDLTPERLAQFVDDGVPFDKCMAGTKYVSHGWPGVVNAGFVYKLVEYESNGKRYYPEKEAKNKTSISGLKRVEISHDGISVDCRPESPGISCTYRVLPSQDNEPLTTQFINNN